MSTEQQKEIIKKKIEYHDESKDDNEIEGSSKDKQ